MMLIIVLTFFELLSCRVLFQRVTLEGRKEITILANKIGGGPFELINVPLGAYLIVKFKLYRDSEVLLEDRDPQSLVQQLEIFNDNQN